MFLSFPFSEFSVATSWRASTRKEQEIPQTVLYMLAEI